MKYAADEDEKRFKIFKKKWEEVVAHNENYARGEIYYPMYAEPTWHETEEEAEERRKLPVH